MIRVLAALALAASAAACTPGGSAPGSLPMAPADIQACFRTNGPVKVPQKALTVGRLFFPN